MVPKPQGILALDIDGTLTDNPKSIPPPVVAYLEQQIEEGWSCLFITGRPFSVAAGGLAQLQATYWLAAMNGAAIVEMPKERLLFACELPRSLLSLLDRIAEPLRCDYVIYGGYCDQDRCYWRPDRMTLSERHYLEARSHFLEESWLSLTSWDGLPIDRYGAIKFFGEQLFCQQIAQAIDKEISLAAPLIADPFRRSRCVLQLTDPSCHKGAALDHCLPFLPVQGPIIAAGDDWNDATLLARSDLKLVVETAPLALQKCADRLVPPPCCNGIIAGLQWAIEQLQRQRRGL